MAGVLPTYLTLFGGSYFRLTSGTANATVRVNNAGDAFEQVTIYTRAEADSTFADASATTTALNAKLANTSDSFSGTLSFIDGGDNTTASINSTTGVITGVGSGLTALNGSNISTGTVAAARLHSSVFLKNTTPQTHFGQTYIGGGYGTTIVNASSTTAGVNVYNSGSASGRSSLGFSVNSVPGALYTFASSTISASADIAHLHTATYTNSSGVAVGNSVEITDSTTGTGGVTALKVNLAGSGTGSGTKRLLDLQKAGTSKVFVTSLGSSVFSDAAISTSATDGFVYFPSCAGTPSGTPTTQTGTVAIVYDTSANKLWAYNGSWRSVTLA